MLPNIKNGDWNSVRQAFRKLGPSSVPDFGSMTLANLTASRLVASDATKSLVSTDLVSWLTGTANRVSVADDGDGTVTLSAPQDIHSGASPTFVDLVLSSPSSIYNLSHDSFADFVAAEHIDWSVTGAEDIHDDRIAESSVTQHEAAITHDNLIAGTIASHDTGATGAELDTLTDGSNADSLHKHALSKITQTHTHATTLTVTTGTLTSGTVSDANTWQDGNVINVSEVTGTPGFDVRFTFASITDFTRLGVGYYYNGLTAGHYCEVQIYDDQNTTWRTLFTDSGSQGLNYRYADIPVDTISDYINGSSQVLIRFYHPGTGNAAHDLYVDYAALIS